MTPISDLSEIGRPLPKQELPTPAKLVRSAVAAVEPAQAVSVRGLTKSYDALEAVRGIDFEIRFGEVFALLGPNGAGKTTTVEILEGYRHRDGLVLAWRFFSWEPRQ